MNLEEMKRKLAQVKSGNKANPHLFKPEEGAQLIRIVPLQSNRENPFIELYFHYDFGGKTILSPLSYGERDPIAEFSDSLIADGGGKMSKDEYKLAKKFYPTLRTFVPIVVRGKESEGVKFWSFGKTIFEKLLQIIDDEDYGDIADIEHGFDLTLTFIPKEKSSTKRFPDVDITPRRKESVLTTDEKLLDILLNHQPDIFKDVFNQRFTYEELAKKLSEFSATQQTEAPQSSATSTVVSEEAPEERSLPADVDAEFSKLYES